ncbi:MAG: (Fe-S)-binding protein [Candidatus Hodarchaeales archaeon]|jgi:Fe-S oxidoreductase
MSTGSQYYIPNMEFRKKINKLSKNSLSYCYQCSTCTGICPLNMLFRFNPREIIHYGQIGIEPPEMKNLWKCTGCGACEYVCPKDVKITDIIKAYRSEMIESGKDVPPSIARTLEAFFTQGNPFNLRANDRINWAKDLGENIPIAKEGTDLVYFVGCTASYDPRSQGIAKALVKIFNHTQINWGIIGNDEKECGNCVNFMGETDLSDFHKEENLKSINTIKPSIIVTTSPHSFNFIKNHYDLPESTKVYHYTQILDLFIKEGSMRFKDGGLEQKITFHDPCFLGRHNKIYNEPRRVLESVPGVTLIEMKNNRELSICCGGGSGNSWRETEVGERLSIPRLEEALNTGASILTTSCYFCLQMFEDAVKVTNNDEKIKVKDIAEIISEAI